jgi:preprotein translocase subunit SecF
MKKFFTMAAQELGQRVAQSVANNPKAAVATALTVGKTVGTALVTAAPYLVVGAAVVGAVYAATKE